MQEQSAFARALDLGLLTNVIVVMNEVGPGG